MKKILFLFSIISWSACSQTIALVQGSLQPLQDQASIIVTFDYDSVRIGADGEFTETDYVQHRKKEYNDKQAGRGDQWEKNWYDSRKTVLEPKFKSLLEKYGNIKADSTEARYTLIFKTLKMDPGWNLGVPIGALSFMRKAAKIDAEIVIIETASPTHVVARIKITDMPGRVGGTESDSNIILSESYAKSGKEVGNLIAKVKKE